MFIERRGKSIGLISCYCVGATGHLRGNEGRLGYCNVLSIEICHFYRFCRPLIDTGRNT